MITGGLRPDHATFARFRARNEKALGGLFSQVLRLGRRGHSVAGHAQPGRDQAGRQRREKASKTLPQIASCSPRRPRPTPPKTPG